MYCFDCHRHMLALGHIFQCPECSLFLSSDDKCPSSPSSVHSMSTLGSGVPHCIHCGLDVGELFFLFLASLKSSE